VEYESEADISKLLVDCVLVQLIAQQMKTSTTIKPSSLDSVQQRQTVA